MERLWIGVSCALVMLVSEARAEEAAEPAPLETAKAERAKHEVDVFLRSKPAGGEVTFAARPESPGGQVESSTALSPICTAPCQASLTPGTYRLELNRLPVDRPVRLERTTTMYGYIESHEQSRAFGLVALYLGGVVGGSLIGVAILGAPESAYALGGGIIGAAGLVWLLTYKSDRAVVKLGVGAPPDISKRPLSPVADAHAGRKSFNASLGIRAEF